MSSITSFKQKCPSCGGQLTIKNSDLIGKKVDCPKCKHRFVVESPDEAPKPKKDSGRRERIADEDRPRKKKAKGGKGMLILGCVTLGVVVVVGIILLVTLGGGDSKTPPVAEGKRGGAAPSTTETKPSNPFDQLDSENPQPAKDKIRDQLQNDAERDAILDKLREKILAGNQAAKDLVKDLAANATKPDLQNKAKLLLADI